MAEVAKPSPLSADRSTRLYSHRRSSPAPSIILLFSYHSIFAQGGAPERYGIGDKIYTHLKGVAQSLKLLELLKGFCQRDARGANDAPQEQHLYWACIFLYVLRDEAHKD